jgi:cysteine synthase B
MSSRRARETDIVHGRCLYGWWWEKCTPEKQAISRSAVLVPGAGIEPARLAAGDFESPASTDFATRARVSTALNEGQSLSHAGLYDACDNRARGDRMQHYKTVEDSIGNTPLVRLVRVPGAGNERRGNVILGKLEGDNPAGSVKDRPAISMIRRAEERGDIKPGDTLIEATSGNTGIALAMAAAIRGYRMLLIMPEDLSVERAQTMKAFGAELILTPRSGGMEYARDLAEQMQRDGKGRVLDQFANADNPRIHYETTGPEIWRDTEGRITHFVSAMGTTGTITGVSRYLKEQNPKIRVIGAQPSEGSRIPGIRKWPPEYLPKIYDPTWIDETVPVSQADAEDMARRLAREDGLFAGISSAGALWVTLQVAEQLHEATIVFIVCDRGDRYLSTGVFPV